MFDREKRPATKEHATGTLLALNAETGEPRWRQTDDIYGTTLAVGIEQGVLLMAYQPTRFRLDSEFGGRMAGFDMTSGKRIWDINANYESRVMLNNGTIYAQGGAWRLKDGKPVPFDFSRSYGCGILASRCSYAVFPQRDVRLLRPLRRTTNQELRGDSSWLLDQCDPCRWACAYARRNRRVPMQLFDDRMDRARTGIRRLVHPCHG